MTASTIKSENITNIEATPISALHRKGGEVKVIVDQDAIPTTSLDEDGDKMLFCPIPSNAVILDVEYLCDELDSNATPTLDLNVGLTYSGIGGTQLANGNTSGTFIDEDCFATDMHIGHDATVTWTSVRFEADNIVDVKKEAWEVGGLTEDPGGIFYVAFTVGTAQAATAAAGDLVVRVTYI